MIGIAIWITDLNATICFMSVLVATTSLTMAIPTREMTATAEGMMFDEIRAHNRIAPNPPNFKRIPARIIDP